MSSRTTIDLKRPQGVISWGGRLHDRRPQAEVGKVVAVTALDSHRVHQPLAWNANLQLPKKHKINHSKHSDEPLLYQLLLHGTVLQD
jgi:hypothetical protein